VDSNTLAATPPFGTSPVAPPTDALHDATLDLLATDDSGAIAGKALAAAGRILPVEGTSIWVPSGGRLHCRGAIGQKFEAQAVDGVLVAGGQRQMQLQQRIEQALLGAFDGLPVGEVRCAVHRRDDAVVAAGAAEGIAAGIVFHQPVAGGELRIGAVNELQLRQDRRMKMLALQLERHQHVGRVPVAQRMTAVLADRVLEVEDVVAVIAAEEFHRVFVGMAC